MSTSATSSSSSAQRFEALAEIAKTLGHAHRLVLLEHVAQGERAVERLSELSGLSVANTSQHLQHLRRAGLVQTRRDGKRVLYRLGDGPIAALLAALAPAPSISTPKCARSSPTASTSGNGWTACPSPSWSAC